jgi:hypothetical protein
LPVLPGALRFLSGREAVFACEAIAKLASFRRILIGVFAPSLLVA